MCTELVTSQSGRGINRDLAADLNAFGLLLSASFRLSASVAVAWSP